MLQFKKLTYAMNAVDLRYRELLRLTFKISVLIANRRFAYLLCCRGFRVRPAGPVTLSRTCHAPAVKVSSDVGIASNYGIRRFSTRWVDFRRSQPLRRSLDTPTKKHPSVTHLSRPCHDQIYGNFGHDQIYAIFGFGLLSVLRAAYLFKPLYIR